MPTLEVRDMVMQFPAIRALDGVSLSFAAGQVHAIVGENGAGKSTLMKILAGLQHPTSGRILLDGREVQLEGVRHALSLGIAMIHQELDVIDDLSVADNVFLGSERARWGIVRRAESIERAQALLDRVKAGFPADIAVGKLSIAGKQLVEIAKSLSHQASILIMDEPTAVLTELETESLFALIRELKGQGVTVLYISHRLAEVEAICDRVSVLRDGKLVCTVEAGELTQSEIADRMVGRSLGDMFPQKLPAPDASPILEVQDLNVPGAVYGASLQLRPGEIVGIAGLVGSGRTELCEAIVGLRPAVGALRVAGSHYSPRSPRHAANVGVAYVSEDRKDAGIVLEMSVVENTTLATLAKVSRLTLDERAEKRVFDRWKERLDIRAPDPSQPILYLSGGNQQKVAIAKWLEAEPRVLILDEPTRGVDVGAKRELYNLIHEFAQQGMACLLVSSELPEIVGLCGRTYVMREGRMVAELAGAEVSEERIMAYAAGVEAA